MKSPEDLDPFCKEFSADDQSICVSCAIRHYLNQLGKCVKVSDLCNTYDNNDGKCLSCYAGFVLDEGECSEDKDFK